MMSGILTLIIRFYRQFISPLKMPCCRFVPTCSEYALEAIKKYGIIKEHRKSFRPIKDTINN